MQRPEKMFFEMMGPLLLVAAGIVVLAVLIYAIRSWYRDDADNSGDGLGMLCDYREMLRRGELTEEEYRFIKSRAVSRFDLRAPTSSEAKQQSEGEPDSGAMSPGTMLAVWSMQPGSPLSPYPPPGSKNQPGPPPA